MGLKFKKINVIVEGNKVCFRKKCGEALLPIDKVIISYEVNSEIGKEILVLGKNSSGIIATLFDANNMALKKSNDSKSPDDYTEFAKATLKSRKSFKEEGNVGKAHVAYQLLQEFE
jgi:hypothetical protein